MLCENCKKQILVELDLQFVDEAYGLKPRIVNNYHVQLRHEEYEGHFDWYHTTGTIIANRNGGANNIGKTKDAEEAAKIITKHVMK